MANLKILTENSTLDQLADVNAPSPNDGDALVWDSGTSRWVPEAVSGGTGGGGTVAYRFAVSDPLAGDSLFPLILAPVAGTIVKVSCVMAGVGSADVNVELEGSEILASDLTAGTSWTSSAALTEAVAAGDEIDVSLKNVVSPVSYIVVQVDFEE